MWFPYICYNAGSNAFYVFEQASIPVSDELCKEYTCRCNNSHCRRCHGLGYYFEVDVRPLSGIIGQEKQHGHT